MEDRKIIDVTITVEVISISTNEAGTSRCEGCMAEDQEKLCSLLPRCETNEGSFIFKAFP